eukprot:6462900-Amphidinium_carterae.2
MVIRSRDAPAQNKRKIPVRRFASEEHKTAFNIKFRELAEGLQTKDKFNNANPFKKLLLLQHTAMFALRQTKPAGALTPKKPWLDEVAVRAMSKLNKLRRLRATLNLKMFTAAIRLWHLHRDLHHDDLATLTRPAAVEWLTREISFQVKTVRSLTRTSKRAWVEAQCSSIQLSLERHDTWSAYRTVRAVCGRTKKLGGRRLLTPEGHVTFDNVRVDAMWTEFWTAHFSATVQRHNSFLNLEFADGDLAHANDDDALVTVSEVLAVIKTLQAKKSTPNILPGEVWKHVGSHLADHLAAAVNQCLQRGDIPNGWKGSVIIPIRKGVLSALMCTSFRPIQLVLSERKVLGRLLLHRLRTHLSQDDNQYCIGESAGVSMPIFILNQLLARGKNAQLSTSLLFLDVKAAYDSIAQQLVMPQMDDIDRTCNALVKLGLTWEQARSTLLYIQEHPHSLLNASVPPVLKKLLLNWMQGAWCMQSNEWSAEKDAAVSPEWYADQRRGLARVLDHAGAPSNLWPQSIETDRGVKQGDALSTWLFCSMFRVVLDHAFDRFRRTEFHEHVFARLGVPASRGDSSTLTSEVCVDRLVYADDLCCPMFDQSPSRILRATESLVKILDQSFRSFGLTLNYKPGKSAAVIRLCTRQAKGLWQHIHKCAKRRVPLSHHFNADVEVIDLTDEAPEQVPGKDLCIYASETIPLHVCAHYTYLGTMVTPHLNLDKEVQIRRALAVKAFNLHASVLTSNIFTVHQRIVLMKSLCLCHLLQQLHTFPLLSDRAIRQLDNTYCSLLKRICRLHLSTPDQWKQLPNERVYKVLGEPPVADILLTRRLGFMYATVTSSNTVVSACSVLGGSGSVVAAWIHCLGRVHEKVASLSMLPPPNRDTFAAWVAMMIPAEALWKSTLRKHFLVVQKTHVKCLRVVPLCHFVDPPPDLLTCDPYLLHPEADRAMSAHDQHQPGEDDLVATHGEDGIAEAREANTEWTCTVCHKKFRTSKGLSSHSRMQHHIYPPLALRTYSTQCVACGAVLKTRNLLLQHLANRIICATFVMENVEPMPVETYRRDVHHLDVQRTDYTREVIPRTGPIPVVDGRPQSQGVTAINPYRVGDARPS